MMTPRKRADDRLSYAFCASASGNFCTMQRTPRLFANSMQSALSVAMPDGQPLMDVRLLIIWPVGRKDARKQ